MSEHIREIANITSACSNFAGLPIDARVDVVASIMWGYGNPTFSADADSMAELARIGANLIYVRDTHKRHVGWL